MKKAKSFLVGLYFSLPVQLLIIHIRNNKLILLFWILLFAFVTNSFGTDLGIPYLFLEPEYLGEVNFWSLFFIGVGTGAFIGSFHISSYILDSYRYHFLALEMRPFYTFALNNSILPIIFFFVYIWAFIDFQITNRGGWEIEILWLVLAMVLGTLFFLMFLFSYFLKTNKNILVLLGEGFIKEIKRPKAIIDAAKRGVHVRYRVDYYLGTLLSVKPVDRSLPADFRQLVQILNQHHGNAMLLELGLLVLIMILGLLESKPVFQIPAACSVMFILSIIMMLIGAITFWFRRIGPLAILVILLLVWVLSSNQFIQYRHPVFGLNYETAPAPYDYDHIINHVTAEDVDQDYSNTINILNTWKENYQANHNGQKPKAVFLCFSGGGLRSAYFSLRCLQKMDSLTNGEIFDQSRLMTGASGGMIGGAYYREIWMRRMSGLQVNPYAEKYADNMSIDLLNRLSFKIATHMFLPPLQTEMGGHKYPKDRGFVFEDQLMENLNAFRNRRLGDYIQPEASGEIPVMLFTPVIINDGRKLFVSATPSAFMTKNQEIHPAFDMGVPGIEFRRFFKGQEADSLFMTSALRMNASFPFITPYASLPSDPPVQLIDAGAADNFGIQAAMRYLYIFRDWFAANTESVVVIQIRDSEKNGPRFSSEQQNYFQEVFDPIGGPYRSLAVSKDLSNDDYLAFAQSWYKGRMHLASLEYIPNAKESRASLSWHLTKKEKSDITISLSNPRNEAVFQFLKDLFSTGPHLAKQ